MYMRNSSKKRKYLIVKLFGTRSCDGSLYVCSCRYNGCINRRDVHIRLRRGRLQYKKGSMMWTSHLLIQPLYLQLHTYKDLSLDLVPNNLTIRYFRFLELFLTYMRI